MVSKEKQKQETVPVNLRFPVELRKQAEKLAEKESRSFSNWLIKTVKEAIEKAR